MEEMIVNILVGQSVAYWGTTAVKAFVYVQNRKAVFVPLAAGLALASSVVMTVVNSPADASTVTSVLTAVITPVIGFVGSWLQHKLSKAGYAGK